jgi:DNA-binding response OmpR family regulator
MRLDKGKRTIDVHVKSIRQKLENHAEIIETVRGLGYRLREPRAERDNQQ